ncbi:MAG TPA: FkbM family methyltransferase [Bradyrhizobium sp.]|nr:FkbM family methyltransferase [Bradyrhizobium sp.]
MNAVLLLKSFLINSPFEGVAKRARHVSGRLRPNLEMAEVILEEERLPEVLKRLLTPTSNVLDVGCHIGSFLNLASKLAPNGRHVAIEASPSKATLLRRRFPSVRIEQLAISDRVGISTFEENLRRPGFSRLGASSTSDPVTRYDVPTTTLDALELGRIDLVKIDIEGGELNALRGAKRFAESNRPPFVFECGAVTNEGLDRAALFDHLTSVMTYDVFTFGDFLYRKGPLSADEFRKCGIYPFRAFNFVALPR